MTQPAIAQSVPYYYANGERIPLEIVPSLIAVQFARAESIAQAQTRFGELVDGAPVYTPAAFAGDTFVLMPTTGVDAGGAERLAQSVETSRELNVVWSNPVYRLAQFDLVVTDEFIAGFPTGTPREQVDAYNARNGVQIVSTLSPDVYVLRVNPGSGVDALTMANRYEEEDVALYGEPNFYTLFSRSSEPQPEAIDTISQRMNVPNDPFFGLQWFFDNTGQFSGSSPNADIQATQAWSITEGSSSIIIAVLDDGVQINHPDLAAKIVSPYDAVTGDNDPSPFDTAITRAEDGHGTAVAGLVGAVSGNNLGVAGTCRLCRIMPIRIFRSELTGSGVQLIGSVTFTTNAINWAVNNGAAVLSNSWGQTPSTSVTNAFRNATTNGRGGLGAVVAVAAGNSYQSAVAYPASLASVLPGFLAVGASNWCAQIKTPTNDACNGFEPWGNNWGSEVGITAPGHRLATTDLTGADGYVNEDYVYFNGTSGATPILAGVAGLVLSQNPTWTADRVRERLMRAALDTHTPGYDVASGWGIVDANTALLGTGLNSLLANDNFANATSISSLSYTNTQSVLGAFVTRDEPSLCALTSNIVWYRYTPTYNQVVTATTQGSNFDTVLGAYTGTPGSFASVACNDDISGGQTSSIQFNAVAGTTYYFAAGSFAGNTTDPGGPSASAATLVINVSTSTPPPDISINGSVQLGGRPAAPHASWGGVYTLQIQPSGGGTLTTVSVTTNSSGVFTYNFGTSLLPGQYELWIKSAKSLGQRLTFTFVVGANTVNFGAVREGDANNDNRVTLTDFSILASAFNRAQGQVGYDARADFNADNTVSLADFSMLASNFNALGADPLGPLSPEPGGGGL
jgi:subtilisin family serine protease